MAALRRTAIDVSPTALTTSRAWIMREFSRIKRLPPYVFSITAS
jgi:hypothetical protein